MVKKFNIFNFGKKKITELEKDFEKRLKTKKKNKPKRHKKNNSPKRNLESPPETMKKQDFERLERGIQRLKEYEIELGSLDTSKFPTETASIKSKLKDVARLAEVEREMKVLRLKIKERGKEEDKKKAQVDYDVGVMIDTDFNDFLSGIKASVSQRVRNREHEIEERLNRDLLEREKKYRLKHLSLMNEFNEMKKKLAKEYEDKYKMDIKINLQREVHERFDRLLKQNLEREKAILAKKFKEEIRAEERRLLENERREVEREKKELSIYKEKEMNRVREHLNKEFKERVDSEATKKVKEIREALRKEFEDKYKKKLHSHEEEMKKKLAQVLGSG